jgi:hypothetical protein
VGSGEAVQVGDKLGIYVGMRGVRWVLITKESEEIIRAKRRYTPTVYQTKTKSDKGGGLLRLLSYPDVPGMGLKASHC